MASNRGVVAGWWLVATLLAVLIVIGPDTARAAQPDGFFRVEWSASGAGPGQSRLAGYVYNDYREDAVNVRLRISPLDELGRPGAATIEPVGDVVRAGGRAFFDVRVPGRAASYEVAVTSFDFSADGEWQTLATQQLLAAAGFRKKVADTPEKLAHLETITPARRLVTHRWDGRLYYVYADPETCKCLYVGSPDQYQAALERHTANQQLVAMQQHVVEDESVVWSIWAPWPWF
ncbi:MAG TPA: hypothetical protein VID28_20150 [Methylomirabilota bacterium]|jgi:hypothetical protein